MKVLKFGGTSVGSVESLRNVKKIVEGIPGNAIIVVSALGGLTDKLISTAEICASGNESWKIEMEAIRERHYKIIKEIVPLSKREETLQKVERQLDGLERNYEGVFLLRTLPEKTLNVIVSFGERMSSVIVAAMVENGHRYYSPDFIKTVEWYGKNVIDAKLTDHLIKSTFSGIEKSEKAIVPGFISTDSSDAHITNLGRGGSDFTGALIAAALDAEILEIWTDVDGFMTADPRIVKEALIIDHLTFPESMELCNFGAKVIYPPTIYPVFHKNIPIKILNTFNPTAPGTLITDQPLAGDLEIKGVTMLKDVALISLNVAGEINKDFQERALNILSKVGVRIIPVANPDPLVEINFAILGSEMDLALKTLTKEFQPEISSHTLKHPRFKNKLAAIAIVGKDMKKKSRLAARIGHSLRRTGINVDAVSAGNSDSTFLFIIPQDKATEALPLIHNLIY